MKNKTENLTIDELTEALVGGGFTKKEATQRSEYTFKKIKSRDASDLLKFAMNPNNVSKTQTLSHVRHYFEASVCPVMKRSDKCGTNV